MQSHPFRNGIISKTCCVCSSKPLSCTCQRQLLSMAAHCWTHCVQRGRMLCMLKLWYLIASYNCCISTLDHQQTHMSLSKAKQPALLMKMPVCTIGQHRASVQCTKGKTMRAKATTLGHLIQYSWLVQSTSSSHMFAHPCSEHSLTGNQPAAFVGERTTPCTHIPFSQCLHSVVIRCMMPAFASLAGQASCEHIFEGNCLGLS